MYVSMTKDSDFFENEIFIPKITNVEKTSYVSKITHMQLQSRACFRAWKL